MYPGKKDLFIKLRYSNLITQKEGWEVQWKFQYEQFFILFYFILYILDF